MDDLKYWLALNRIKEVGPVSLKRLISIFKCPEEVFKASYKSLLSLQDIGPIRAKSISEFNQWDEIEKEIVKIRKNKIKVIRYNDNEYPELLRDLEDPPILIYCIGELLENDKHSVAIVGSRRMTPYGSAVAEKLAYELASLGITIVSGMARGIDSIAHKGALRAKGRSIAVLGSGVDKPYPIENKNLFNEISSCGAVISEFPLGTSPNKENFPKRNRLISGFSLGVIVVEATINSGSLITANYALEQGREVFAVPGNIFSKNSEGTNLLIKKGAKLVDRVEDVLEELAPKLKKLVELSNISKEKRVLLEINDEEKAIFNILGEEPKHIDNISRELNIPIAQLSCILLNLELKGVVRQLDGKKFCLINNYLGG